MIDLLSVKLNGDYDYIQDTVPNTDCTWLCSDDISGYTKGYSYQVTQATGGGVATRIEAKQDYKILNSIYPTIESVCQYLNNYFPVKRQANDLDTTNEYYNLSITESRELNKYLSTYGNYLFQTNQIQGVQELFLKDDLIRLQNAIRNNYISYVTAVTGTTITVANALFAETIEDCRITLMRLAQPVEQTISEMIYYNVFVRDALNNLQSETIGNYSYSKATVIVGGLAYPSELTSQIEQYKYVRFV